MPIKPCLVPLLLVVVIYGAAAEAQTQASLGAKYPVVSAYLVRPDVLMTAKFSDDGQVCEMELEKRHWTTGKVDTGPGMPRELVRRLIDELAPPSERGRPAKNYLRNNSESTITGNVEFTESDFERVSIEIVGSTSPGEAGDVVVTIRWKNRACSVARPDRPLPTTPR
jgi:hypothetical protein